MAAYILAVALVCACVAAAPPAPFPPHLYPQPTPAQLSQIDPFHYYMQSPEISKFYGQSQEKQGEKSEIGSPARLENLDPNSEVEYIAGAQPPQQLPQQPPQPPLAPNLPGLLPDQRVFIVQMPVPGYSPGSIAGYQPVYVVAAAPQGGNGFNPDGYQNGVYVNSPGQTIISPGQGYPQPGAGGLAQPINPSLGFGTAPFALNRPFNLLHQTSSAGYQPGVGIQGYDAPKGNLRLAQLVALQGPGQVTAGGTPEPSQSLTNSEPKRLSETSKRLVAKEASEEPLRGERPSTRTQIRKP